MVKAFINLGTSSSFCQTRVKATFSPVVHAAVVTEAGPGGKGVMLTQKPDGEHPVTRTDFAAFAGLTA